MPMALIDCPTCGQQVAVSARRCPHCGILSPQGHTNRRTVIVAAVIIAVAALFLLLFYLMS
jgi:predicted nucleic acid-binding Zn ribbon protein